MSRAASYVKKRKSVLSVLLMVLAVVVLAYSTNAAEQDSEHLENLLQLTFGGENIKAKFGVDGRQLIFQAMRSPNTCDQIFAVEVESGKIRRLSMGSGRTTCGYFVPGSANVVFASTHLDDTACPPRPPLDLGYVWPLYSGYDVFWASSDGVDTRPLTDTPGYDADTAVSPDGRRIVFTSVRNGDPDLYSMKADGTDVRRLTTEEGYDGNASFSPDGNLIVYCGYHPSEDQELEEYRNLLRKGYVRPDVLEIFIMGSDGTNRRQITFEGAASFGPSFHPDGKRIIFSSNLAQQRRPNFDLYLIRVDGTGLERVTALLSFDAWPVFSPDGKKLAFISNRDATEPEETNIFIADWIAK